MKRWTGWAIAAIAAITLIACGGAGPQFIAEPRVAANPNPQAPLAAVLTFAADRPVATTIRVSDGTHAWELRYDASHDPAEGLPVVGMRPERRHEIRVRIEDEAGRSAEAPAPLEFTTPALPSDPNEFPPVRITVRKPEKMEPGWTIFNPRRRKIGDIRFGQSFGMLLAVDGEGTPVWYYRTDSRISDLERLSNGNLAYITQDYRLVEIDMLGNVVRQWYAKGRPKGPTDGIPIDTLTFHHEVDELPNGNLVILGSEIREIDNYYTSEYDPNAPRKRQRVMGDEIIEFTRDGEVVWRWKAFDHMDPFRIGYETFSGYWERRGFPGVVDWSHANGLMYDPNDDSLLVCFRYQAAILKIDRKSGQVKWVLGEPSGWSGELAKKLLKPEGEMRWFYHQHAPHPTPNGTLLLFDNGSYGARPFTPPLPPVKTYSRAVEYAIDEAAGTVKQVWESEGPGPEAVVSFAMGDVDWMPETGNILVHYGLIVGRDELPRFNWKNFNRIGSWTRIREYTHTTPPEVVWELVLGDPSGKSPIGWALFGGDRWKSWTP